MLPSVDSAGDGWRTLASCFNMVLQTRKFNRLRWRLVALDGQKKAGLLALEIQKVGVEITLNPPTLEPEP